MPATRRVTSEFTYDRRALRYRRAGKFVSSRAVKLAVRRVIRNAQAEMRAVTDQMIGGKLTVGEWRDRFRHELKNLHVSGAMAGQGGPASMTPGDYLRAGREIKSQYRYLDRFARQAAAGELSNATIRSRAAMYVNSMNGAYESGREASAIGAGYDEVRNVLGDRRDHCRTNVRVGCLDLTRQGWAAIGSIPVPGKRQCLTGCGCTLKFRKSPAAKIVNP
jgi:hypothetical protein